MKICMLSADFLPNIGGITAHVYELSKALVKQGNDVYVITLTYRLREKNYQKIDGIKVHRIYYPRLKFIGFFAYLFLAWLKLKWLILKEGIDVIHSHTLIPDALIARFIRNIPKVATKHSSGFLEAVEKGEHKRLYRWLLGQADCVIGPSQELVDAVVKLSIGRNKTSFIPNGVDIDVFHPQVNGNEVKERYGIVSDEKLILCPRRLVPKNGVEYFIRAIPIVIKQVSQVKCLIVGPGSERARLGEEVVALGIADRVIFADRVPNSEMPKYYAASDIAVLPSLIEATSIAGLEAMATGKPLVGTNIGGIPQIIADGETGILVPPRDPEKLAYAIISLLNDNGKRVTMGLNARKRAETEFRWQIIAEKIQNVYDEVT